MNIDDSQQEELSICELCDLPADGLDQIHCQVHWEQECDESWEVMLEVAYGVKKEGNK